MRQPWHTFNSSRSPSRSPSRTGYGRRPSIDRGLSRPLSSGAPGDSTSSQVGLGFHTSGDIEEEVRSLHTDMMRFGQDLRDQLFLDAADHPKPGVPEDKIALYLRVWRPLMSEWLTFRDVHKDSFWQNLPGSGAWDRVQDFRERMRLIRDQAKTQQFHLTGPDPLPPRRDPDLGDTATKVLKVAAYAGVGIAGLILLTRFGGK